MFRKLLPFLLFLLFQSHLIHVYAQNNKISQSCLQELVLGEFAKEVNIPSVNGFDVKEVLNEDGSINYKHKIFSEFPALSELERSSEYKQWFKAKGAIRELVKYGQDRPPVPTLGKYIRSRQEGMLAKIATIRHARYTVDTTYFIFFNDNAGKVMINELTNALERGVSVRAQVDWAMNSGLGTKVLKNIGRLIRRGVNIFDSKNQDTILNIFRDTLKDFNDPYNTDIGRLVALIDWYNANPGKVGYKIDPLTGKRTLRKATLQVQLFNPLSLGKLLHAGSRTLLNMGITFSNIANMAMGVGLQVPTWESINLNPNRRSHDKITLADRDFPERAVAVVGGANIEDLYYERNHDDQEMIIVGVPGAAVNDQQNIFKDLSIWYNALWGHLGNRQVKGSSVKIVNSLINTQIGPYLDAKHQEELRVASQNSLELWKKAYQPVGEDKYIAWDGFKPYNDDGSINKSFDYDEYLSRGLGVADMDLTYTLANLFKKSPNKWLDNKEYQEQRRRIVKNQNGILKHLEKAVSTSPRTIEEIHIISPYPYLTKEEITRIRQMLKFNPDITLYIHINSVITNDMWHIQALFENDVIKALKSKTGIGGGRVSDQVKIYMKGRINDRRFTQNQDDFEAKLRHMKGLFIKRKNGTFNKQESMLQVGLYDGSYDEEKDLRDVGFIGTYNKDPRSRHLNSEVGLVVRDGTLDPDLQHLPDFKFSENIERYITDRLILESHEYESDEFYEIRDIIKYPQVYTITQKLAILSDPKSVEYLREKHGRIDFDGLSLWDKVKILGSLDEEMETELRRKYGKLDPATEKLIKVAPKAYQLIRLAKIFL